ncbi:hypothetical protein GEMRC1_012920 [Eukaryota sp. GEM-RC1]
MFWFRKPSSSSVLILTLGTNVSVICRSLRTVNQTSVINLISSLPYEDYQSVTDCLFDVVFADCTRDFSNLETSKPFLTFCLSLFDAEIQSSSSSFLRTNSVASKLLSRFFSSPSVHQYLVSSLSPLLTELLNNNGQLTQEEYYSYAERTINLLRFNFPSLPGSVAFLANGINFC